MFSSLSRFSQATLEVYMYMVKEVFMYLSFALQWHSTGIGWREAKPTYAIRLLSMESISKVEVLNCKEQRAHGLVVYLSTKELGNTRSSGSPGVQVLRTLFCTLPGDEVIFEENACKFWLYHYQKRSIVFYLLLFIII